MADNGFYWPLLWLASPDVEINLPDMNGIELQKRINELSKIPVIITSKYMDVRLAIQAMKQKAFAVLEKPFFKKELLQTLHEALKYSMGNLVTIY